MSVKYHGRCACCDEHDAMRGVNPAAVPDLVAALEDMAERWALVAPLFGGKEYNSVRPDTSEWIARAALAKAREVSR